MLLALTLLACGSPDDTGADRLDIVSETDSVSGTYHLSLTLDPDPAVVGLQTAVIALTRNADSAPFDNALVAGATLTGSLTAPEQRSVDALSADFDEAPSGTYTGTWTWSAAAYWELRVGIGDQEDDDVATFAIGVDAAR